MDQLEGMTEEEIAKYMKDREAKTRAKLLEIIGDIPDADIKPPENVLFVCKLNPVTTDEDLELIFSRFGKINSCEVIRDKKTGDSLCYAFIDFDREEDCENAFFKMDNVLIDDRRIHVDFSQSVSKVQWKGKGTGTGFFEDNRNFQTKSNQKGSNGNDEQNERPQYKINNKSRKGHGYNLVFDEEAQEEEEAGKKYEPIKKEYQKKPHNEDTKSYKNRDERERDYDRRDRGQHRPREEYNSFSDRKRAPVKEEGHRERSRDDHNERGREHRSSSDSHHDKNRHKKDDERSHKSHRSDDHKKSCSSSSSSSRRH